MNLHYSQTSKCARARNEEFHYLMNLHYSQTVSQYTQSVLSFITLWIYTILKLLSPPLSLVGCFITLWIYTILKRYCVLYNGIHVLLPYEFTLFSNCVIKPSSLAWVLLPYEFTLFSNLKPQMKNKMCPLYCTWQFIR